MIERRKSLAAVRAALKRSPVTLLVGPRQSGKTTLARLIVPPGSVSYFDLEDPRSLARLSEPMTALSPLRGTVVIDEIQRSPDLFPVLRVLVDRKPLGARFLILGSASPKLLQQSSETLAGRVEAVTLGGLDVTDLPANAVTRHWRRGGFPRSYLARTEADSLTWRQQFIQTYLERDLPELGVSMPAPMMLRFWTMLAHFHAQVWNAAEPARSLGISMPTVRRYLDFFSGLYLVRQLQPWHENLGKRQVKAPKLYIRDSGIFHALLGLASEKDILSHPKAGASWEGYVLEEILKTVPYDGCFFWAAHSGAELDLLLFKRGRRFGVEIKYQDAPKLTPSMRTALQDLKLAHLTVVYPGDQAYKLAARVDVIPFVRVVENPALITPPAAAIQ
jgi:predicted AAA+ superfamily ATPase